MFRNISRQACCLANTASVRLVHTSVWASRTGETRPPLTKIVATIGPASENLDVLQQVVTAGLRVMRINFSHATYEEADLRINNLRLCRGAHKQSFNMRAVLLDTQGPEIRTGTPLGVKEMQLDAGQQITLTTDKTHQLQCIPELLYVTYTNLPKTVSPGSKILLDDGLISLKVLEVLGTDSVKCLIENGGMLGAKKGVNLPGCKVDLPALSVKDKEDIRYGIKRDIDFIAASFVRKAQDIIDIRTYVDGLMKEFWPLDYPAPKIIAKIESTEAMDNFEEILLESDGIMVARGDLGVEIPMEQLTNAQKEIVRQSNIAGKPVIVATQMLESMQKNPRPTRAEVSDVTNAVYDGADAVMLSGESAKGKYPVESVKMMRGIIDEAERWSHAFDVSSIRAKTVNSDPHISVAFAAAEAATQGGAKCMIVITRSGRTARYVAGFRPSLPVVCFTPDQKVGRQLIIHRALHPVIAKENSSSSTYLSQAVAAATELGFCSKGDKVVLVSSEPEDVGMSSSVSLRVLTVQ